MANWFAGVSNAFTPATTVKSADMNQNFADVTAAINTGMPSGCIVMWSGAVVNIPTGWNLCNGSNGTPDLRGKFVYGAGGAYAVNDTGGEETHLLTGAESGTPVHSHGLVAAEIGNTGALDNGALGSYTGYKQSGTNKVTDNSVAANASSAHNNLPPYFALCFIQKS